MSSKEIVYFGRVIESRFWLNSTILKAQRNSIEMGEIVDFEKMFGVGVVLDQKSHLPDWKRQLIADRTKHYEIGIGFCKQVPEGEGLFARFAEKTAVLFWVLWQNGQ